MRCQPADVNSAVRLATVCAVHVRVTRTAPVLADVAGGRSIQTGVVVGTAST